MLLDQLCVGKGRQCLMQNFPFIINSQTLGFQSVEMITTRSQNQLVSRSCESCSVIPTDATGTNHQNLQTCQGNLIAQGT